MPTGLPERIDRFRVVRELGRGGMGVVVLAERDDGEFRQRVAIKLLAADPARAERLAARLRAERQILAALDHPGIAKLLDGGALPDGSPFLVMEYVEGERIDRYCDRHGLGTRARLDLLLGVCDAVESAHRRLIVHRDLKPGNILVNPAGEVKLLDFGIAKLLDPASFDWTVAATEQGVSPLTLLYASPEQVRGEPIGTASDVYSLGIVLYELLTGRSPYAGRGRTVHELWRAICDLEPPPPSSPRTERDDDRTEDGWASPAERPDGVATVTPPDGLDRDLDAIVLKALRKDAAERYPTVAALADDIRRYLGGHPVLARRGDRLYRAGKFARRHRWALAAAAAFVLVLAGWAVSLARQLERTRLERDRAERVRDLFVETFAASDPTTQQGEAVTAREILDRATPRLESELADQPAILAPLLEAAGRIYLRLDLLDRAEDLLGRSLGLRRAAADSGPDELRSALASLADLRVRQARFQEAVELLAEALRGAWPESPGAQARRASLLLSLGNAQRGLEQYDAAARSLDEAVKILHAVHGETHLEVAEAVQTLGNLAWEQGDLATAGSRFREAREMLDRLGAPPVRRAAAANDLAAVLNQLGEHAAAEALLREALDLERLAYAPDHPSLATTLNNLAVNLYYQRDYEGAANLAAEAFAIQRGALGDDHPDVATTRVNLAALLLTARRIEEAEPHLERAAAVFERTSGGGAGRLALVYRTWSTARYLRADLATSRQLLDRSAAAASDLPEEHPVVAGNLARRGILLHAAGSSDAEAVLRRAIALQDGYLPEAHGDRVPPLAELAVLLARSGRAAEGLPLARRAAELAATNLPPESLEGAWARAALGIALASGGGGAGDEAPALLAGALPPLAIWLPEEHPRLRWAREAASGASPPGTGVIRSR
jgi:serine/threonine-protein kinase